MKKTLSKNEREELESLKKDLVHPIKAFVGEVYNDTVGDAKQFYSAKAQKAQQNAKLVQRRTEEQMSALVQRREEQQKQRNASVKRIAVTLVLLVLIGFIFVSVALSAKAEEPDSVVPGESCLTQSTPDCGQPAFPRQPAAASASDRRITFFPIGKNYNTRETSDPALALNSLKVSRVTRPF